MDEVVVCISLIQQGSQQKITTPETLVSTLITNCSVDSGVCPRHNEGRMEATTRLSRVLPIDENTEFVLSEKLTKRCSEYDSHTHLKEGWYNLKSSEKRQ